MLKEDKTKEEAQAQPSLEERISLAIDIANTNTALATLASEFEALQEGFTFPTDHVEFACSAVVDSASKFETPSLAYTGPNTAVHAYENGLVGLLTRLDGIESHGISMIREARRRLVVRVEKELEGLDERKWELWRAQGGAACSAAPVVPAERSIEAPIIGSAGAPPTEAVSAARPREIALSIRTATPEVESALPADTTDTVVDPFTEASRTNPSLAPSDMSVRPNDRTSSFRLLDIPDEPSVHPVPRVDGSIAPSLPVDSAPTEGRLQREYIRQDSPLLDLLSAAKALNEDLASSLSSSATSSPKEDFTLLDGDASDSDSGAIIRHLESSDDESERDGEEEGFEML